MQKFTFNIGGHNGVPGIKFQGYAVPGIDGGAGSYFMAEAPEKIRPGTWVKGEIIGQVEVTGPRLSDILFSANVQHKCRTIGCAA